MPSEPHPLALPPTFSPDDLDPLTELALVLAKVRASLQPAAGSQAQQQQQQQRQHQQSSQALPPPPPPPPTSSTQQQQQQQQQQLSFKDVPGATDGLKHKLQRARAQVAALPDMQLSLAQQRDEMRRLEDTIALQRGLLERLRDGGVRFGKDDGAGEKMEM